MESDLQQHHHHHLNDHQLQQHQRQLNSSLTRYQSAPSSYFSSFLDRELCEDILKGPSSPETERIFAKFLSSTCGNTESNIPEHNLGLTRQQSPVREKMMEPQQPRQIIPQMNNQSAIMQQQQTFSSASQSFYQSQPQQNLQTQNSGPEMDYRVMSSVGIDRFPPMKMNTGGNTSNLIRHSSSPAGLFSDINIENGYVVMKSMGEYGVGNNTNREASYPSAGRPPQPVSSGQMSPIAEMGNTNNNESFDQSRSNNYSSGFPIDSWNDSTMMSENMGGMQRLREDDRTLSGFSEAETENVDVGNRPPPLLAHHLSLPKDISTIEKLLQFQDSVPCKIRAKRGCATHPRSIAERVRRTKISERMRKLQDLVPNMDKQTNTADMLDLAVDYVKELQQQVKALSDKRAKCTCANKEQP